MPKKLYLWAVKVFFDNEWMFVVDDNEQVRTYTNIDDACEAAMIWKCSKVVLYDTSYRKN